MSATSAGEAKLKSDSEMPARPKVDASGSQRSCAIWRLVVTGGNHRREASVPKYPNTKVHQAKPGGQVAGASGDQNPQAPQFYTNC